MLRRTSMRRSLKASRMCFNGARARCSILSLNSFRMSYIGGFLAGNLGAIEEVRNRAAGHLPLILVRVAGLESVNADNATRSMLEQTVTRFGCSERF